MNTKTEKQMAKMVDAVQPHCDEPIAAAMTCSHSGSMSSALVGKLLGGFGLGKKASTLPNPVFIAVSPNTIYAFKYAPRGFNFKIKKEVARWSKDAIRVETERTSMMAKLILTIPSGESHHLEIPTMMGGAELVDMFFGALNGGHA